MTPDSSKTTNDTMIELHGSIDLITAALQLNDANNDPIEECLKAARSKLRTLCESIDRADLETQKQAAASTEETAVETTRSQESDDGHDDEPEDRHCGYALLPDPQGKMHYTIGGIHGIAQALDGPLFDNLDQDAQLVVMGLVQLTAMLYEASSSVNSEIERRVHNAIMRPDTAAEAMEKRLRKLGYALYSDLRGRDVYAVGDHHGTLHMSVCGLGEIEAWLERKGIEKQGSAS